MTPLFKYSKVGYKLKKHPSVLITNFFNDQRKRKLQFANRIHKSVLNYSINRIRADYSSYYLPKTSRLKVFQKIKKIIFNNQIKKYKSLAVKYIRMRNLCKRSKNLKKESVYIISIFKRSKNNEKFK